MLKLPRIRRQAILGRGLGLFPDKATPNGVFLLILLLAAHMPVIYLTAPLLVVLLGLHVFKPSMSVAGKPYLMHILLWAGYYVVACGSAIFHTHGIGNIFWSCFFATGYFSAAILLGSRKFTRTDIDGAFEWFLTVQCGWVAMQLLVQYARNPGNFLQGGGDGVTGSAMSLSSILSVTAMSILGYYIAGYIHGRGRSRVKIRYVLAAGLLAFLPGYMSGFLMFLIVLGVYLTVVLVSNVVVRLRVNTLVLTSAAGMILVGGVLMVFAWSYFDYVIILMVDIFKSTRPLKLLAYQAQIAEIAQHPFQYFAGVGLGNGNSRAAFLTSGDPLVPHLPMTATTQSDFYANFVQPFNTLRHSQTWFGAIHADSILNTVYSQFLEYLTEGGILGMGFVVVAIAQMFLGAYHRRDQIPVVLPMASLLAFGIIDYWAVFPNGQVLYWLWAAVALSGRREH